ncbi:MAG TPA: penicillin-binding protein 2 [Chthoniobacteraceae bacterium]|nr:penicillin-binding protein 2 [Chthoniobacteraceae bacterium]
MKAEARLRMFVACICLAACFTGFSYRLIYLQVVMHDKYAARADEKHGVRQVIYAPRGVITDVHDGILAANDPVMTVVADNAFILKAAAVIGSVPPSASAASQLADLLSAPLAIDRSKLQRLLSTAKPGTVIKKDVPGNTADDLEREMARQGLAGVDWNKDDSNAREIAGLFAKPLGIDQAKLLEMLCSAQHQHYIVLKKGLPETVANDLADQLRAKSLRGITFEHDFARTYPNGSMLSHVIGYMDHTHEGIEGIEKSMNDYLRGYDGFRVTEKALSGKELVAFRGQERAARPGYDVHLTIDMGLQTIVEAEMDNVVKQYHPQSAVVILMNPWTGEILALSNRPNFDPNDFANAKPEDLKNHAVVDMVEPGSIFKIVTASAALNENVVNEDTMIFCENGLYEAYKLHDHKGYGDLNVAGILKHSSNIGAAKLAMLMGDERFYEYIRSFGFGDRTGVLLPGEIGGMIAPPHQWSRISISRLPMGQGVGVTAMQTAMAISAVANGGHLMMPQIVHNVTDANGAVVASYPPVEIRQVIAKKVSAMMCQLLKGVVSPDGTAPLAAVPGFANEVAGKTGTAQIPRPKAEGGGYYEGKYVASFEGFMPADKPAFVCLVMIQDAKTGPDQYYGGQVAAPVFSHIAEKAARYLNIAPYPDVVQPASSHPGGIILTQRERSARGN